MAFCRKCAIELDDHFSFCPYCGTSRFKPIKPIRPKKISHFEYLDGPLTDMKFSLIPAGSFLMGSPEDEKGRQIYESPQHRVTIRPFYILSTLVTQVQWCELIVNNPSEFIGDNLPVDSVTWYEVQEFLRKLNDKYPGYNYRLPSEAEWEYACRAGTTTPFYNGKAISTDKANYDGNSPYRSKNECDWDLGGRIIGEFRNQTTPVRSFAPNAWGLYDMQGNLLEWCDDCKYDNYINAPIDGTAWVLDTFVRLPGIEFNWPRNRVQRGGSWLSLPRDCRSAYRGSYNPGSRDGTSGFRIAFSFSDHT